VSRREHRAANRRLRIRRSVAVTVAISAAALCGAAPVAANVAADTSGSRNYRSEITEPGAPGLSWQVIGGDAAVELENRTEREVIVVGYTGEPYLRFVPGDGVYRNTSSPATYLNEDRYGDAGIHLFASASADPVWEQMADTNRYSWHDHRAHWMSRLDPPIVVGARDQEHIVVAIAIPLVIGDGPNAIDATALGEVRWLPWRAGRRSSRRWSLWSMPSGPSTTSPHARRRPQTAS